MTEDFNTTYINLVIDDLKRNTNSEISDKIYKDIKKNKIIVNSNIMKKVKSQLSLKKTDMTCIVFKIINDDNESISYTYLYALPGNKVQKNDKKQGIFYKDFGFIMYCNSPSLISQDGEFRINVLQYEQFILLYKKYPKEIEYIEDIVLNKIENNKLVLNHEIFYPTYEHEVKMQKLNSVILDNKFHIRFFVIFYLSMLYDFIMNIQSNHITYLIKKIIFKNINEDKLILKNIKKLIPNDIIIDIISMCKYPVLGKNSDLYYHYYQLGQKFTPLKEIEVQQPYNLSLSIWKELFILKRLQNMHINNINNTIPIMIDWFYIKNNKIKTK